MRRTLLMAILLPLFASSQVQQDWVRKFVGSGSDNAAGIAADRLGNVYICGNNNWGLSTSDIYTIRYNSSGTQTSGILYNSPYNNADEARAIATDASSNVYVAGKASVSSATSDVVIIKYNSSAVQQWVTIFNTPQNYIDDATAMAVDGSGNVYITGSVVKVNAFEYDYLTAKFNASGVLQWYALYNGTANGVDIASDIAVDASGNVYVTGLSAGLVKRPLGNINTGYDYATIKYDANGNELWVRRYNYANGNDEAKALALDASGNVYITGSSPASSSGNLDCATIKYATDGTQQWVQRFAGAAGQNDAGNDLAVDGSGYVYVAGYSYNSTGRGDLLALKYATDGTPQWTRLYSGGSNTHNIGKKMGLDAYANMYIALESSVPGVTASDFITVKYTSSGTFSWSARYNSPENATDYPTAMTVVMPNAPPGSAVNALIYVTGISNSDVVTIKYSQPTVICCAFSAAKTTAEETSVSNFKISSYPNPAASFTNIQYELPADGKVTISIHDVLGRKITTLVDGAKKAGTYSARLNTAALAGGNYHYQYLVEYSGKTFRQTLPLVIKK